MKLRLERLTAEHPIAAFSCGNRPGADAIDAFLHDNALAQQTGGWSRTTLAIDADRIAGYFTLSPGTLRVTPSVLTVLGLAPAYPQVGGYLLGRLGVDQAYQGRGLGALLVERAIATAQRAKVRTGGAFLAVDAKNEQLTRWYLSLDYGFVSLDPQRGRLVVKL